MCGDVSIGRNQIAGVLDPAKQQAAPDDTCKILVKDGRVPSGLISNFNDHVLYSFDAVFRYPRTGPKVRT